MEKRVYGSLQVRASKSGDQMRLGGYAAKYGVRSHVIAGQFREYISSGAFDRVLATKPDVVALINHNANHILGRTASGTLRLHSDAVGLGFEVDLPNTSYAKDLHASVLRGDMNACSFAFRLGAGMDYVVDTDNDDEDGDSPYPLRVIRDFADLHDISIVTNAAYPETSVDAREEMLVGAEIRSRSRLIPRRSEPNENAQHLIRSIRQENVDRALAARRRNRAVAQRHRQMIDFLLS